MGGNAATTLIPFKQVGVKILAGSQTFLIRLIKSCFVLKVLLKLD